MDENKETFSQQRRKRERAEIIRWFWVMLYQIAGWVGLIAGLIFILDGNWTYGASSILVASSAFFAAHVLQLMEKAAHNLEQQTELLQKLVDKR